MSQITYFLYCNALWRTLSYKQTNIYIRHDSILVEMEHVLRINMIKNMIENMLTMNVLLSHYMPDSQNLLFMNILFIDESEGDDS